MAETSETSGPHCTHLRVKYVRMVNNVPGEPVTYWDRWMCVDCDEDFAPKEAIASAARREERARLIAWVERNYFEDDESVVEMLKYLREPDLRDIESEAT